MSAAERAALDDRADDRVDDRREASRLSGNSSGRTASVEPAALHMPSASEPDLRPMQTTTYQRAVVRASSIKLSRMPAPTDRAVSNPNVGAFSGSGRSLSIVFGTVATPIRPRVRSAIRAAP